MFDGSSSSSGEFKKNQNKYLTESTGIMILMRHQLLCSYDIWDLQKEASCHDK